MPLFLQARLHYPRNRLDDTRLLRERDGLVRAWHWDVTFATAKSCRRWLLGLLPSVLRMAAKYIEQREDVYRLLKAICSSDPFFPRIRCVLSAVGMGWQTYLYEPVA